jgi:hypothetical protein
MAMNEQLAIEVASEWVRSRYPVVPPILTPIRVDHYWSIAFFCSWDTDALGMPETLIVAVDDKTHEVHLIS